MLSKLTFAAVAITLLVTRSQGVSLTSKKELDKRENKSFSSWWTWSSRDGYHSGTGSLPTSSYPTNTSPSVSVNARLNAIRRPPCSDSRSRSHGSAQANPVDDSYASGNAYQGLPIPTIQKPPHTGSQNQSRYQPPPTNGPGISTKASDVKQWLDYHNKFRAQYGASALTWNPELAAASKRLTDTCFWRHTQNNPYGENMSAGQNSIKEVVDGWVIGPDERASYSGPNSEPSHFTQVVWLATTQVGCHSGTCQHVQGANLPQSPVTFWACNYNPPGNVIGEFAQNVKAATGGAPEK